MQGGIRLNFDTQCLENVVSTPLLYSMKDAIAAQNF